MTAKDGERDLVGYGRNPPHADWPDGARVALNFVLNVEEGSEYSVGNGDGFSEATLTEVGESWVPRGERDLAAEFDVRVRQPCRGLAHIASVPRAKLAPDRVWLPHGDRAQPGTRGCHPRSRL